MYNENTLVNIFKLDEQFFSIDCYSIWYLRVGQFDCRPKTSCFWGEMGKYLNRSKHLPLCSSHALGQPGSLSLDLIHGVERLLHISDHYCLSMKSLREWITLLFRSSAMQGVVHGCLKLSVQSCRRYTLSHRNTWMSTYTERLQNKEIFLTLSSTKETVKGFTA